MRTKGHVFGARTFTDSKKNPVRKVSGSIGYIKWVSFQKKRVSEDLWCPNTVISRMRLLKKEQVYHFLCVCVLGGGLFFPGAGLLKQ